MCGIVGFNGKNKAVDILLDGLSKLEYRGYDSVGIAIKEKDIEIYKAKGKLVNLKEKIKDKELNGTCGIGHTRWATHGEPSEKNAHPHISNDGNVTLVHNGIIENYQELIEKLHKHGYTFYSDTDTEVLANLIDYYYKKYKMGPIDAINRTMVRVRGSYAIVVMFKEYPDELWVAKKDSPMIIGESKDGMYVASDVPAILKYTNTVYYINDMEAACLKKNKVVFYDLNGDVIKKESKKIDWDISSAEKEGYEQFVVPDNVYIIGTMNTADRSIALIDTALRRRFAFKEMIPKHGMLNELKIKNNSGEVISLADVLEKINQRVEVLLDREHTIGHAYFTHLLKNKSTNYVDIKEIGNIFKNKIIPLLQEYFYDDYEYIALTLGEDINSIEKRKGNEECNIIVKKPDNINILFKTKNTDKLLGVKPVYTIEDKAFYNFETYRQMTGKQKPPQADDGNTEKGEIDNTVNR
jgi:predicted glutamine amidotransferase